MRQSNQPGTKKRSCLRLTQVVALTVLGAMVGTPRAVAAEPTRSVSPERTIVISLADRKLAVVMDGRLEKVFQIAVGKARTPSPTGELRVVNKIARPNYYHHGVVIKPGANNPLGPRWIGLSRPGYGIHGTNEPHSIGKAASHGCFRMSNADIKELFTLVQVGDAVEIHSSRDDVVSRLFPENGRETQPEAPSNSLEPRTAEAAMASEF